LIGLMVWRIILIIRRSVKKVRLVVK
jgi:hypothetical protein